jgi:hypothetical protein
MRRHDVPPERVCIDVGGGGKQVADRLRSRGYRVRTVGFGTSVTPEVKARRHDKKRQQGEKEERYAYVRRRDQLYGEAALLCDPAEGDGFAIPRRYHELRRQLAGMPLVRDHEGRLKLPPKNKKAGTTQQCLTDILGASPDEADSFTLAIHAMLHEPQRARITFG